MSWTCECNGFNLDIYWLEEASLKLEAEIFVSFCSSDLIPDSFQTGKIIGNVSVLNFAGHC